MSGEIKKDLRAEARNFSASLTNVFLMKRRDPQTKHLLEKAQNLIDSLLAETPRVPVTPPISRTPKGVASMGQLWVKLDELKRENDDLKRQKARATTSEQSAGSPKSPKSPKYSQIAQAETLSYDVYKLKSENEALKVQIERLQTTIKEHQMINASLQDETKRAKVALEAAQMFARKAREDSKKLEAALASLKSERSPTKQNSTSSASTATPPTALTRADNRLTENISEKCRPSNIAVAYTTLESQEWMDAKESLEDRMDEEQSTKLLCHILMKTYQANVSVIQNVEKVIGALLENPALAMSFQIPDQPTPSCLPVDVSDIILQKFRASFDKINTDSILQIAKTRSCDGQPESEISKLWSDNTINNFLSSCVGLTWQMVVQKPPMILSDSDSVFDGERHRLWWSCDQSKATSVDYCIWPVLYDYEGGNLMVKGCVHAS